MTRRSDAVNPRAHALILRKVADRAVEDARAAWRKVTAKPGERNTRAAYRACVFAARAMRQAAQAAPADVAKAMADEIALLDAAALVLKVKLARLAVADPA